MMISPEMYRDDWKEATYREMMEERDRLVHFLKDYEEQETTGNGLPEIWDKCPTPDVEYQMSLLYLSELCRLMQEKYNQDVIWGEHSPREIFSPGSICRPEGDQKETDPH